jgi:hypothetical protein
VAGKELTNGTQFLANKFSKRRGGCRILSLCTGEDTARRRLSGWGTIHAHETSNQFLNSVAETIEVEARNGQIYSAEGLEAAFRSIKCELMPMFEKQEANRKKNACCT